LTNEALQAYNGPQYLSQNLDFLQDDSKSVISYRSSLSKGYYKAPRASLAANTGYQKTKLLGTDRQKEYKGLGRTLASEYDYSTNKNRFSKHKRHNSECSSVSKAEDYLTRLKKVSSLT